MDSDDLSDFFKTFCADYAEKNFKIIVERIHEVLKFEINIKNNSRMKVILVYSIIAMQQTKSFDLSMVKKMFQKFQASFGSLVNCGCPLKTLEFFNALHLITKIDEVKNVIDKAWLDPMIDTIMEQLAKWTLLRAEMDRMEFKKFIIVVMQLEAFLKHDQRYPFPKTKIVLKHFETKMCTKEQKESGWPALLLTTVRICELSNTSANAAVELLTKVRNLTSDQNKYQKDIAIMISQILAASMTRISELADCSLICNIMKILLIIYEIIRNKSLTSELYWTEIDKNCCDRSDKHTVLRLYKTSRTILIRALTRGMWDDALISYCVNFFVVELQVIDTMDCSKRPSLLCEACNAAMDISKLLISNQRSIRTIQKFLLVDLKDRQLNRYGLMTKLIEFQKFEKNEKEILNCLAMRVLYAHPSQRCFAINELHIDQSKQPISTFQTIVTILNKVNGVSYGIRVEFDQLDFLFQQLKVEIEYPKLKERALVIIKEIRKIKSYCETAALHVNLIKAAVRFVEYTLAKQSSKDEKATSKAYYSFDGGSRTINMEYEGKAIQLLKESVSFYATFLSQEESWTDADRNEENIAHMVKMLYKIGIFLMCHQFKALAIEAFQLLYRAATIANNVVKQTIAAGYLVENNSLMTDPSMENEMMDTLSSNIMKKLRSVSEMTVYEKTDFLLAVLHLSAITLRRTDVENAKKYMRVVDKLLDKHDPNEERFSAVRLKYCQIMFEMFASDPDSPITPMIYIDDIFHRFKAVRFTSSDDNGMLPAILYDIVNSLYMYTEARREFIATKGIVSVLWAAAFYPRYVFLLSKVTILCARHSLYTENTNASKIQLEQLHILFGSIQPCDIVRSSVKSTDAQSEQVSAITSEHQSSTCSHNNGCTCIACEHESVHLAMMEISCLKARSKYCEKENDSSRDSFKFLYNHWQIGKDCSSFVTMLMMYSDVLSKNEANNILLEALQSCNEANYTDAALMQDIQYRIMCNTTTKDMLLVDETKPYELFNGTNTDSKTVFDSVFVGDVRVLQEVTTQKLNELPKSKNEVSKPKKSVEASKSNKVITRKRTIR